jgi:hypothetical protein
MQGGASGRRPNAVDGIHTTRPGSQAWRGLKARAILGHCGAFWHWSWERAGQRRALRSDRGLALSSSA